MTAVLATANASQRFTKSERLLSRAQFLTVQSHGRRLHTPNFIVLVYHRGDQNPPRLGVTTSRKVAKSVRRNQLRRWIRETFRTNKARFYPGHDYVVIARENLPELTLALVQQQILEVLQNRLSRPLPPGGSNTATPKKTRSPRR